MGSGSVRGAALLKLPELEQKVRQGGKISMECRYSLSSLPLVLGLVDRDVCGSAPYSSASSSRRFTFCQSGIHRPSNRRNSGPWLGCFKWQISCATT